MAKAKSRNNWTPSYSKWRDGGWYVNNVRYPNGACGCVSNNYYDEKWRIVCDDRRTDVGEPGDITYPSRDAAARAERDLANALIAAAENAKAKAPEKQTLKSIRAILNDRIVLEFNRTAAPRIVFDSACEWFYVRRPGYPEYTFTEDSADGAVLDGDTLTMPDAQGFPCTFHLGPA